MKSFLTHIVNIMLLMAIRFPWFAHLLANIFRLSLWRAWDREVIDFMEEKENLDKMRHVGDKIASLSGTHRRILIRSFLVSRFFKKQKIFVGNTLVTPPRVVNIFVTRHCNISCSYCYVRKDSERDLSTPLLKKILDEVGGYNTLFICISGGEPLMRKDFLPLLSQYPQQLFLLFTNGILLDPQLIETIANMGNIVPIFALDGWKKRTDAVRGDGTWEKFESSTALLKERGISFGISAHIDRNNFNECYTLKFLEAMVEYGCICVWYSHHISTFPEDYETTVLTPEQRIESLERCEEYRRTLPIIIIDSAADPRLVGGCPAGGYIFCHIENNGNICPCPFLPFPAGNIRDMTIAQAMASRLFVDVRKLGRFEHERDHVAGCIALDKREQMVKLAAENPSCMQAGGRQLSMATVFEGKTVLFCRVL